MWASSTTVNLVGIQSDHIKVHFTSRSCPIQTIPLSINYNILVINSTYILFSLNRKNPINYANFVT